MNEPIDFSKISDLYSYAINFEKNCRIFIFGEVYINIYCPFHMSRYIDINNELLVTNVFARMSIISCMNSDHPIPYCSENRISQDYERYSSSIGRQLLTQTQLKTLYRDYNEFSCREPIIFINEKLDALYFINNETDEEIEDMVNMHKIIHRI